MKYIPILLGKLLTQPIPPIPPQVQFIIASPNTWTTTEPPFLTSPFAPTFLTSANMSPAASARMRTAAKKKNDSAADELQKQVALEKKKRELKKKQWAAEKRADEEKGKRQIRRRQ